MSNTNSTTSARLADTDWTRFTTEAEAMAIVIKAQTPYLSAREIGMVAAAQVEANYAAEIARSVEFNSDAMIADAHNPDGSPRYALPTPIIISDILDALVVAVDAARQATDNARWLTAIDAAADYLLRQEVVEIDDHDALIYRSESGQTYFSNGVCQCRAYEVGQPCRHRAASRLVHNALALHA